MIIKTPSRLHMTLIDLNGSYGRADGGIGLTIEKPNFVLESETTEKGITVETSLDNFNKSIIKEHSQKIERSAQKLIDYFDIQNGYHFNIKETMHSHSGLGSGTQVSLATAKLICETEGININISDLGLIVGRGITSGIGTFAFDKGGFIVDGGYNLAYKGAVVPSEGDPTLKPKLIGRYEFPEEWNIVIAIPEADTSVTGKKEIDIFNEYCPVPKRDVEQLSHLILMNLIPFILEKNIVCVGKVIDKIQNLGFKKAEVSLQQKSVRDLMTLFRESGGHGAGMSSFGPAVYTITDKDPKDLMKVANDFVGEEGYCFATKAKNSGYEII